MIFMRKLFDICGKSMRSNEYFGTIFIELPIIVLIPVLLLQNVRQLRKMKWTFTEISE